MPTTAPLSISPAKTSRRYAPLDAAQLHPHAGLRPGPSSPALPTARPRRASSLFSNTRSPAGATAGDGGMTDPRTILGQARQTSVPVTWRVFTKKRGKLCGFLRGSSQDPDPLLVITPDGAIEYANERKPLTVLNFYDLAEITLRVRGSSFSDSTLVSLDVWIDLHYRDGTKTKWRSTSFADNLQRIQCLSKRTAPTRHFENARRSNASVVEGSGQRDGQRLAPRCQELPTRRRQRHDAAGGEVQVASLSALAGE